MNTMSKALAAGMRLLERRDAQPYVVVDVGGLVFCDSSGLNVFDQLRRNATALGRTLVLRSPRPGMRRVLELTGMAELVTLQPSSVSSP
jgi:anti-sigma B factor antagonist